ncbi:MAG: hypothetical protein D6681_22570 [Calditrichaeota bacterium]|nr:MAG: hypothetical protein D6681_22570 [Calditrichota bacterium]
MSQSAQNLIFYCELCEAEIEKNICPVHGIDFVTVKKGNRGKDAGKANNGAESQPLPPEIPEKVQAEQGRGIATFDQIQQSANLPDVPDSRKDPSGLTPISEDASFPEGHFPMDQADLEEVIHQQMQQQAYASPGEHPPEPDYYEAEAVEVAPEPSSSPTSSGPSREKSSRQGVMILALVTLILIGAAAILLVLRKDQGNPTALYSRAEAHYAAGEYEAALNEFTEFANRYPEDPLTPTVQQRIAAIQQQLSQQTPQTPRGNARETLRQLMVKANLAFQKQRFISPKDDNVMLYLNQILKLDPEYTPALELREKVRNHYYQLAEAAAKKKDYVAAIGHYEALLKVNPGDAEVLGKIHALLTASRNQSR